MRAERAKAKAEAQAWQQKQAAEEQIWAQISPQQARQMLQEWNKDRADEMADQIESIIAGKGTTGSLWGTVTIPSADARLLDKAGVAQTDNKVAIADLIKAIFPADSQVDAWPELYYYHTGGTGKGKAGFNLTGHTSLDPTKSKTLFNLHIV